jgi:hypothetical protein
MPEDGIAFVGMRPDNAPAALLLLVLQGVDVSLKAVEFPLQGGEVVDSIKVTAELSCDPPVPHVKGPGDDCVMTGWISDSVKEPLGVLPILVDSEALGGKEFLVVDRFVLTVCAQSVLSIKLDVGGEDVDGVGAVSNWNKEVADAPFILLVSFRLPLVISVFSELLVAVRLPVLVGLFKASCVLFTLRQSVSLFLEGGELGAIGLGIDFILSRNSSQSLGDEDELLSAGAMSFESGACGSRGEA